MTAPIRSMGERYEVYRIVTDYDALHEAFVDRVEDMNVSRSEIEAAAKLPAGYASKLLSTHPKKRFGPNSLGGILKATGTALVLVVDTSQVEALGDMRPRIMKGGAVVEARRRAALASALASSPDPQLMPETSEQLSLRERMKILGKLGGKKGGKRRLKTMGKRARQRAATHAARIRWAKHSQK